MQSPTEHKGEGETSWAFFETRAIRAEAEFGLLTFAKSFENVQRYMQVTRDRNAKHDYW